ncbi:MAG: MgtC/SapB family protein [Burkholderiales bacterium]
MDISLLKTNGVEFLPAFLTSLAIGLLIGLERERSPVAKAGLRTFTLVTLFGTMIALIADKLNSPLLLAAGLATVGLMIIAAYQQEPATASDPGTTTVIALLVSYALGALVWYGYSTLAVMLAITITILLYFKPELRGLTLRLTRRDLVSILQFAVLTFIVLPILPDRDYGPYNALNPHQIWLMVVFISGLSLAGYVALQLVGQRYGAPLLGILGGMASSTATTLIYSRHGRSSRDLEKVAVVVILLANMVVLVRLGVEGSVIAPDILPKLAPVLGAGLACGLVVLLLWWRRLSGGGAAPMPEITNPTEIRTSLGFGLLYAAVLFCAAWLSDLAGNKGLYAVALVSGLTDVDAITLTSLRLFTTGKLVADQTVTAITLAFLANLGFKMGIVIFVGGAALARRCAVGMAAIGAGAGLALWLF